MKDKQAVSEYNKRYYQQNKERLLPLCRARSNAWCKNNRTRRNATERQRRAQQGDAAPGRPASRKYRLKLKIACITAYGGQCACCGEKHLEMLTMDHLYQNGAEHRRGLTPGGGMMHLLLKKQGYPPGYQCLCFNCNYSRYLGNGLCVHQREAAKT